MMRVRVLALLVMTTGLAAATASAQADPRVGLSMGFPASVGVVWHVTDAIALRPQIGITRSSTESTTTTTLSGYVSTTTGTNDYWQVGTGVSVLFYVSRHDALRTYVSPAWTYTRSSSSISIPGQSFAGTSTTNGYSIAGSYGAQYAVGQRFSVFGEFGVSYSRASATPSTVSEFTIGNSVSRTTGTRGGAGVILYF